MLRLFCRAPPRSPRDSERTCNTFVYREMDGQLTTKVQCNSFKPLTIKLKVSLDIPRTNAPPSSESCFSLDSRLRRSLHLFFILLSTWFAHALDVPPLEKRVNDLAGMLPGDLAQEVEERLRQFEQVTSHQVVVLTIRSLEGDSLEDFSIRGQRTGRSARKISTMAQFFWSSATITNSG